MVERDTKKVRFWFVDGENRQSWGPLVERFVDTGDITCVISDGGKTYCCLEEDFGVNHEVVIHNKRFVNSELEDYELTTGNIRIKVHTNTIEGIWGHIKCYFRDKRGIPEKFF